MVLGMENDLIPAAQPDRPLGIAPSWPGGVSLALRKRRVSDLMARDGVVAQDQKDLLKLNHHPVRSIKGSFAIFFLMSRPPPPGQEGRSIASDLASDANPDIGREAPLSRRKSEDGVEIQFPDFRNVLNQS